MLFSCKITHSVISYLDRRGEDLETVNEKCDWPAEFLRDPSSWLEAEKMESLLKLIESEYGDRGSDRAEPVENLVVAAGHQCKDLRSWGALDSVLRMVQAPKDLFAQPERFLSYFVSPAPPVGEVRREAESVSFVLPVSEVQFPLVTSYLRAALEALPTYISKPMASVTWQHSRVTIAWSERQESLFGAEGESELQLHPELVRNIFQNMEASQTQLEDLKRDLIAKDKEIDKLRAELVAPRVIEVKANRAKHRDAEPLFAVALHDLYRLGDYLARGQQLITLLIGQGRQTSQVQEAMRRVDWEFVAAEGPKVVQKIAADLQVVSKGIADSGSEFDSVRTEMSSANAISQPIDSAKFAKDQTGAGSQPQKSFDGIQRHVER